MRLEKVIVYLFVTESNDMFSCNAVCLPIGGAKVILTSFAILLERIKLN